MAMTLPRAIIRIRPQQPAQRRDVDLRPTTERFEGGRVVRLGRSHFAGHDPAHIPTANAA